MVKGFGAKVEPARDERSEGGGIDQIQRWMERWFPGFDQHILVIPIATKVEYSLEVQRPLRKWVFTKDYFFKGNLNHPKLGTIILIVFDFQGTQIEGLDIFWVESILAFFFLIFFLNPGKNPMVHGEKWEATTFFPRLSVVNWEGSGTVRPFIATDHSPPGTVTPKSSEKVYRNRGPQNGRNS